MTMSTAVLTSRLELDSVADTALKAAARFWFAVTVIGQLVFAFTVVLRSYRAARGLPQMEFHQRIRPRLFHGKYRRAHARCFSRDRHARRGGSVGSSDPQPLPRLSPLEWAYLHADRRQPQRSRPLHDLDTGKRRWSFCASGFYSERRPDLALRRHGAALCAGPRFQDASPLGSSLLPGGECIVVFPPRVLLVADRL